jgi:hypothetical protein
VIRHHLRLEVLSLFPDCLVPGTGSIAWHGRTGPEPVRPAAVQSWAPKLLARLTPGQRVGLLARGACC